MSNYFDIAFLLYAALITMSYLVLGYISAMEVRHHFRRNSFLDYKRLLSSPFAPSISIIAPVYNESIPIIDSIRSLLSLHYVNFDLIIVNDGSQDDSLDKVIKQYNLVKVNYAYNSQIKTKRIRGVYKSLDKTYSKLIVVDKENGGKADALNAGINISGSKLVACIDVDCMFDEYALIKMVMPYLMNTKTPVIATGGVIRIVNRCIVDEGKLVKVQLPKKFVLRIQVLEYFRAFILGRMAWGRINGLLIISGAFGLFDRDVVINVKGFDPNTVGEDMELVVRMRRYMEEQKKKYRVAFIPDPLCWTEAPISYNTLSGQRQRWARGATETLWKHKRILFNYKYQVTGLLSLPYWFLFEWLTPFLEFFGLIYFGVLAILNLINWKYFLLMTMMLYAFAVCYSALSILAEELTYHRYEKKREIVWLFLTAMLEPFIHHPFMVWSALKANWDFFTKKKLGWGNIPRSGFDKEK